VSNRIRAGLCYVFIMCLKHITGPEASALPFQDFETHRQLTAEEKGIRRQLTAERYYGILYVCFSLLLCVNNNFPFI